jgi:macrolide transport system ATP-binding/permease protein
MTEVRMDSVLQDIRYSLRALLHSPMLSAVAILSLGLGIGANTTIFTLINTLFLNPLPVARPSELVALFTLDTKNTTRFGNLLPLSYPNLEDFRAQNDVLTDLTGYSPPLALACARDGEEPERVFAQLVTGNYFDVLGITPAAGRFFVPDEDRTPGTHAVAVIGHSLWQRRFGASPAVIGSTVTLNRQPFTIVGVAPEGFKGVTSMFGPDIWLPSMMAAQVLAKQNGDWLHERAAMVFSTAGRLKPGVTRAQAEARFQLIARALEQEYANANTGRSASVLPLTEATLFPGMRAMMLFGSAVLMTIVGLVLLIACSNVANLLLARATARRQEIAIRLALGAGRRRLVRQLLTESALLAMAGGAAGIAFGYWGRNLLWSFRPAVVANNFVPLRFDGRVFVFALALAFISCLIFGLIPALRSSRPDVIGVLKEEAGTTAGAARAGRLRRMLVVGQVALSLVALVVAAMFLRNIQQAFTVDLGYDPKPIAVVSANPGQVRYEQTRGEQFYRGVRERISALPGVAGVSWAANQPLWASMYRRVVIEGREPRDASETILTLVNTVDTGYFATLDVPVRAGRDFTRGDSAGTLPVAIVNDTMAAQYWPNQDPIGRRIRFDSDATARQIVGIVKTIKYQTIGEPPQSAIYVPLDQNYSEAMVLYVRSAGNPAAILPAVEREIRQFDRDVPLENAAPVVAVLDQSLWMMKLAAGLLGVFGALALALASIGLYGVMAYAVTQRQREIGLRMALGADRGAVLRLVLTEAGSLVVIGVAVGLGLSALASRGLSSLLFGLSPVDPAAFGGASALLVFVSVAAGYLPARRASRLDPMIALRHV